MEINQIRYAAAIAQYGNFSKAAEHLFVTQPTLSQQVRKLEDEIGFPLFVRTTRTVSLTEEGKAFLQHAFVLLDSYDALVNEVAKLRRDQGCTIQLGVLPTFSHLNILETVRQFQTQNHVFSFNLQIQNSNELLKMLLSEQLDAAIANISKEQTESLKKELDIHVFFRDEIHTLVNVSHPLAGRSAVSLPELADGPIVMLSRYSSIYQQMQLAFKQAGVLPATVYNCPEIYSLIGMLQSGIGVSFLSSHVAEQYIHPPIVSIPLKPELEVQTAVIYRKLNHNANLLKELAGYIEHSFFPTA